MRRLWLRNDRWLKVIITSILLIFIIVLPLFCLDDSLKTRVAILPMINKEQSKLLDVICQTMTETIELTLKLMDKYRLTKVEGIDPYKDFMIVRHYLQVNRIDNAIFGKASIDEGVIVFQMSVYDRRKDEITVTKEAIAENIFEIFNASDELVVSLVESFSGMHIGFGEIQLKNTGEEGEFKLYIDGKLAGEDLLSKANVLIGNRSIEIKQKRMFREVVIFHTAAQIIEDEVIKIEFKIPYLLIEEKEVLDRLDGTIKKFWDNRDEAEKVVRSINEALVLLSNVSFCVRLKEARNRYKQIDAEYKIKSNRWELEENLFEPNPKIIEEVVEIYENAERYIHPEKIREKASKNINYFYNLLGLAAVYNFSRSKWEDGLEKYKQMERINNRVSIGSNYLFNDEKEYVYRVYDEYINMERESLRYIKTQLTKYLRLS